MERQQVYWKIGELADRTGVSVGTLRYYSDLGLLHLAKRGENGYRYYGQDASKQVEFIKKAQALGFTLEEIGQILDVRDRGQLPCSLVRTLLNDKIEQLATKIEQTISFKAELEHYRSVWANTVNVSSDDEVCPLIASVSLS